MFQGETFINIAPFLRKRNSSRAEHIKLVLFNKRVLRENEFNIYYKLIQCLIIVIQVTFNQKMFNRSNF